MKEMTHIPEITADFYTFAVTVNRHLSRDEIAQLSGCIGYALRVRVAGEDLSDPVTIIYSGGSTTVTYWYDTTKGQRSERDPEGALEYAAELIRTGTPIRTTNRAGFGTAGTRLVEGLGSCSLTFAVDIDPTDPFTAPLPAPTVHAAELVQACARVEEARAALAAAEANFTLIARQWGGVA